MAKQLGLLERAKLEQEFDQARKRAEKLRILHSLGLAIASEPELEQVLTRIVEAAVFITEAEEGSLLLLDEGTDELNLRAQKGLGDKYARGFRIPVQDSLAGEVLRSGEAYNLTGPERSVKVVTGYLVNAILYVPVAIKGRVIGVLAVDNQSSAERFTEDDESLLLVLAGYAAVALENARRLEESERRFQTLAALHGVGEPVGGQPLEVAVDGILVGDPADFEAPRALTPDYLATVIGPCLGAITDLQCLLDELAGRPSCQVTVLAITQDWPVPVSLAGAKEALQAIQGMILPRADEYAAGKKEVAIELALGLAAKYQPDLRDTELIAYVTRLLPLVETFLLCPLQPSVVRGD